MQPATIDCDPRGPMKKVLPENVGLINVGDILLSRHENPNWRTGDDQPDEQWVLDSYYVIVAKKVNDSYFFKLLDCTLTGSQYWLVKGDTMIKKEWSWVPCE